MINTSNQDWVSRLVPETTSQDWWTRLASEACKSVIRWPVNDRELEDEKKFEIFLAHRFAVGRRARILHQQWSSPKEKGEIKAFWGHFDSVWVIGPKSLERSFEQFIPFALFNHSFWVFDDKCCFFTAQDRTRGWHLWW